MDGVPAEVWAAVTGNVIVQWFLVAIVILTVGTSTAEKLKGPLGSFARWVRSIGQERENRESAERRALRQQLIADAVEGREFVSTEIADLKAKVEELYADRDQLARLVREHMGWDHDRVQDLIAKGVRPGDIPTPPPLRVPWGTPSRSGKTLPGAEPSLT